MLHSKLQNNAAFYLGQNFIDGHLVNSDSHNEALGIRHIGLRNPNTNSASAPVFKLSLMLTSGITIYGDIFAMEVWIYLFGTTNSQFIFVNKDGKTLSVRWPQDSFVVDNRTQYIDKVNVPVAITAQVLRHAQTQVAYTEKVEQPVQQPVQQVQQPVQTTKTVVNGIELNTEPTPEELMALFAQS